MTTVPRPRPTTPLAPGDGLRPPAARPGPIAVDLTRVLTTAEWVLGGVLVARALARRPAGAQALVTMGPGGWVSMRGGRLQVRPARRGWRRLRTAAAPAPRRRPLWARLSSSVPLRSLGA